MTPAPRAHTRFLASTPARAAVPLGVVLLLGCIFNSNGAFFSWETHRAMLREISVHGMLACGMTIVIVTGGIDLSVGGVLALGAVVFALLTLQHAMLAVVAIPAVLVFGLVLGAVSGLFVARFAIQPFVATLATMVFSRGLAKLFSGNEKIAAAGALPDSFGIIDARIFGGNLSVVTLVFAVCAAATWLVLDRLRIGRYLYATGGSVEAARLSGVPVGRVLVIAYAMSGFFSTVAGICQAAQETHGDPETGLGYELDAIAMVVLGGTSLSGGRGGIGSTLVGALTLGYLQKILSLNAFSTEMRLMLTGAVIVAAVMFQNRLSKTATGAPN